MKYIRACNLEQHNPPLVVLVSSALAGYRLSTVHRASFIVLVLVFFFFNMHRRKTRLCP